MKLSNICLGLSLLLSSSAHAADNVYLTLRAGANQIKGESSVTSLGRQDTIECYSYEQNAETTNGRRTYEPLVIRKRIDKSSPLLMKAMVQNQALDATFKFFRPNPAGDGTTEQFYTVTLKNARILSIGQIVPDTRDKTVPVAAPLEEVSFAFSGISWTYTNGGVTTEDGEIQMSVSSASRPILVRPSNR